jgi:predicted DNA-binding transcriptional regulator AlpA
MYLNPKQIAERFGISQATVSTNVTRKPSALPPFIRIGRMIRFPLAQLEQWEADHLKEAQNVNHTLNQ